MARISSTLDQGNDEVPDLVRAARRIVPEVLAVREEAEISRRIPESLAKNISSAGLSQMFLPRSVGGPEAPPLVAFQAIEELSRRVAQLEKRLSAIEERLDRIERRLNDVSPSP